MVCCPSPLSHSLHSHRIILVNQIERWFAEITAKRIRRGTFRSIKELTRAIEAYIRDHNRNPKPFVWTATARSILRKAKNYKETLETAD